MGFRDTHVFNLAMLAKQAWLFVTGSHSLFFWVYKARCFPHCSFMDAELGHNPSFVWRTLLAARDLIREGSLWKIGNGQSVQINCNKWLPHPPLFKPGANTNTSSITRPCSGTVRCYKLPSCNPRKRIYCASHSVIHMLGIGSTGKRIKPNNSWSEQAIG